MEAFRSRRASSCKAMPASGTFDYVTASPDVLYSQALKRSLGADVHMAHEIDTIMEELRAKVWAEVSSAFLSLTPSTDYVEPGATLPHQEMGRGGQGFRYTRPVFGVEES